MVNEDSKYCNHTKELLNKSKIHSSDILDYSKSPLENIFEQLFLFCLDNIERFSLNFKITPAYFFFRNTFNINAGATYKNNCYIIFITQGMIVKLNKKLGRKRNFIWQSKLVEMQKLDNELTDNLGHLMFQCSMIFTFYHEFAHLVQQKTVPFYLNENSETNDFSFERHVYEYDADINGAIFVSMYVQQYFNERLKESLKTKQNLDNLMYLAISSITITFILFLNNDFDDDKLDLDKMKFYLRKKTHPHTFVRLNYVIKQFIHTAKSNFSTIDLQDTISNVSKICHEYFRQTSIFTEFATNFNNNFREIEQYNFELNMASQKMKNLIRHKEELFKLE